MSAIRMSLFKPSIDDETAEKNYEYEKEMVYVDTPLTSGWVIIPGGISEIGVALGMVSGTGKIQYTMATMADIDGDSVSAGQVFDWQYGEKSVPENDVLYSVVKAIRFVVSAGAVVMNINCK